MTEGLKTWKYRLVAGAFGGAGALIGAVVARSSFEEGWLFYVVLAVFAGMSGAIGTYVAQTLEQRALQR